MTGAEIDTVVLGAALVLVYASLILRRLEGRPPVRWRWADNRGYDAWLPANSWRPFIVLSALGCARALAHFSRHYVLQRYFADAFVVFAVVFALYLWLIGPLMRPNSVLSSVKPPLES